MISVQLTMLAGIIEPRADFFCAYPRLTLEMRRAFPGVYFPLPCADPIIPASETTRVNDKLDKLISASDRCVMCGMCLAICPTYRTTLDENESPRGRIALIRAVAHGDLALSAAGSRHLDNCLNCRACERVCPSKVAYGELIDGARRELGFGARVPGHSAASLLVKQLSQARNRRLGIRRLLRFYQASGVRALTRMLGFLGSRALRRWDGLLPKTSIAALPAPLRAETRPANKRVALFTGCVVDIVDQESVDAACDLLGALGYEVVIPGGQHCCGALRYHAGDQDGARRDAQANLRAFEQADVLVSLASGCTSMLRDYEKLGAGELAGRVFDIIEFLAAAEWPDDIALAPLAASAAVHEPCSMRNVLRAEGALYKVLGRIPALKLTPLPDNATCCGAAGRYMLDHPLKAETIRAAKISAVAKLNPDLLLSNNVGCALHIASGLRENGQTVTVMHPITLLARQLAAARKQHVDAA